MHALRVKTIFTYFLILAAGLGIGSAIPYIVSVLKPSYVEDDYSAYYPNGQTRVVLYGTDSCPYCIQARAFLRERNIAFVDRDVSASADGRREFSQLGRQAVPVILVGDRMLTGFNPDHLESALNNAGYVSQQ